MLKVAKFGGSSMADANQFKKIKDIVNSDESRKIIVVSAPGKRKSEDIKITDLLYLCWAHLQIKIPCYDTFKKVSNRFLSIKNDLGLDIDLESSFKELTEKINNGISQEELISRGEHFAAKLMAQYLGFKFIDSADWLIFNYDGNINKEVSYKNLQKLAKGQSVVIPGFYGSYEDGSICLLQRGGSDITGALAAAALEADIYENWTDVSGVLMADPSIVDAPKSITELTYDELGEMSNAGSQVLHEETIAPIMEMQIPLNIRNTNNPEDPGTMIRSKFEKDSSKSKELIKGIAGKKDYSIINFALQNTTMDAKFKNKCSLIFEKFNIPIEYSIFSVDTVSFIVKSVNIEKSKRQLMAKLTETLNPHSCEITDKVGLVTIVGQLLDNNSSAYGKILTALGEKNISAKVVIVHPELQNLTIGVDNNDFDKAVSTLYQMENK